MFELMTRSGSGLSVLGDTGPGPSELLGFYGNDLGAGTQKVFLVKLVQKN